MTDEEIRLAFRRIKGVVLKLDTPEDADDYHLMVLLVSDLSAEPYSRVFAVCLDEE